MKILMLATDGYGCLGGVAQFNRDFLDALNMSPRVDCVTVWPRNAPGSFLETIPRSVVYDRAFAAGKGAYVWRTLFALLAAPPTDLVICAHLHLLPLAWLVAKRRRAPLALVLFGIECWRPTRNPLTNLLAGAVDHILSVSRFTGEKFCAWSKIAPERCVILPGCVDLDAMTPGKKPAALQARYGLGSCRTLLTMGRLAPAERYKGFDEIIELLPRLLKRFPDVKYVIAGEGGDVVRLKNKAAERGVGDRVIFAGRIEESEKADHYRLADVFVMPSVGEGFGIVLIEAAACGAVVIGSKLDGSREALLGGALGALIDPRDADKLFDALATALAAPRPRARNDMVATFGRPAFRARVASWIEFAATSSSRQTA